MAHVPEILSSMKEIKREYYLNQLISSKQNGLIKIVTGIRRCGKSYLLFKLFRDHLLADGISPDHIISLALDDILNDEYCDPKKLLHYIKGNIKDSEIHYVLLDEVQMVNNFVGALNSLLHIDNVDVYVTGSNSKFLSSDIATEFRGRGDEIRIYLNDSETAVAVMKLDKINDLSVDISLVAGDELRFEYVTYCDSVIISIELQALISTI